MLPRVGLLAVIAIVAAAGGAGVIRTGSVWAGLGFALVGGGAAVLVLGGLVALAIALGRSVQRLRGRIRHA